MNAKWKWIAPRAVAALLGLAAGLAAFAPLQAFLLAERRAETPAELAPTQPDEPADLALGPRAARLARLPTAPVAFRRLEKTLDLPATFGPDETTLGRIVARAPGRIERLFVNSAGAPVTAGRPFARLYSPALESAQKEFLLARASAGSGSWDGPARDAARRKLLLLGVTEAQIRALEERGAAPAETVIFAQAGGTVLDLAVREGMVVKEGTVLAHVADLSRLWAEVWVGEEDLFWVRLGQELRLETDGGAAVTGTVSFLHPEVDPVRRAVKVRVEVGNPDGRLRPGLFARAVLRTSLDADRAASLPGLSWRGDGQDVEVLAIPARAVLAAGGRRLAFRATDRPGTVEAVDVAVGPGGDGFYPLLSGLKEGDAVVAAADFALDSEEALPPPHEEAPVFFVDQEHCPVMGGKVDRSRFVDWAGLRVYFCCPACDEKFLQDPESYLRVLEGWGERPVSTP